jgi:phage terminase small subunit
MKKISPLTPQMKKFAREFAIDSITNSTGSHRRAALLAGYSPKTAAAIGRNLMMDERVKNAVADEKKQIADKLGITPERVLKELALIGFGNVKDYISQDEEGNTIIDIESLDRDAAAVISEVNVETSKGKNVVKKVKVKPYNKLEALLVLGKHLGLLKEQVDVNGTLTLEQLVEASIKKEETQSNEN